MTPTLRSFLAAALAVVVLAAAPAVRAAKPAAATQCYRAADIVGCFLDRAGATLRRVEDPGERADAVGELLYTLAATGRQDPALLREAMALAGRRPLAAYREMNLLYAIDLYQFSTESPLADVSYRAATSRFHELEKAADAGQRLDLYSGACAMLGWEEAFLERWSEFVPEACNADKLRALKPDDAAAQAWVLGLLPAAMTAADEWDGYLASAGAALGWLDSATKATQATKAAPKATAAERNFLDRLGIVMYSLNAVSLDLFEEPQAAAGAIDRALKYLRSLEKRVGLSAASAPLRRALAERLFRSGREREARLMVRQLLASGDADRAGKRLPLAEQVAVLALAASLADFDAVGSCPAPPAGDIKET